MVNPAHLSFRNSSFSFGLNDAECCYLDSVADALPGRWFVQRDQDDLGHSTVVLLGPEIGENTPDFLISREHGRLYLGLGLAESYLPLGPHADVQGVMECVQRTIHRLEAVTRWMAVELVTRP